MKINHAPTSWEKYSKTLADLVTNSNSKPKKNILAPAYKNLRPHRHFVSWPSCPKRRISFLCGYTSASQLELKLELKSIKNFLKRHSSLARTEPLLRNSSLLNHQWHGQALEKAVAIKRMASLLHETLSTMKILELVQTSNYRG